MKVLLIKPGRSSSSVDLTDMTLLPSLSLEILAASIMPHGHQARIVDLRLEPDLQDILSEFAPDVVGITSFCTELSRTRAIARTVKQWRPATLTLVGGHHATVAPQDFLSPHIDVIVRGEGERTLVELLAAHEKGISLQSLSIAGTSFPVPGDNPGELKLKLNADRPLRPTLDEVPDPAKELTVDYRPHYRYLMWREIDMVETARGCPYRCDYCSIWKYYNGLYRTFAISRVVRDFCATTAKNIIFSDDDFLVNSRRTREICDAIEAEGVFKDFFIGTRSEHIIRDPGVIEKLCRIGLNVGYIGAETARYRGGEVDRNKIFNENNEKALRILQSNGIATWVGFVIDPEYTHDDFDFLEEYLDRLGISFPQFTILTPLPGTELYNRCRAEIISDNLNDFDFLHLVLPSRLPTEEFCDRFARLWRRSYLSGGKVVQMLKASRARGLRLPNIMMAVQVLRRLSDPKSYLSETARKTAACSSG